MDFSVEIEEFEQRGDYTYQLDGGGNLLINEQSLNFNQHYISIPINNTNYNISKIETFYPIEFTEFISPVTSSIISQSVDNLNLQLSQSLATNAVLMTQLDSLIMSQQSNTDAAVISASQQIIVGLRISLGQGKTVSDFSSAFPYLPIS